MNNLKSRTALSEASATQLQKILSGVDWLRGWQVGNIEGPATNAGFNLSATLPLPQGGNATLCVECKQELRPSLFRTLAEKLTIPIGQAGVIVPVLAMPTVSQRIAELCVENSWSWYDLAGNYWLDIPGLLSLHHTGSKSVSKRPRPKANLSTAEVGRVIRALLAPENLGKCWTQREMQLHCQPSVSLGLVNKVVQYLRDEAFIEERADRGFELRDPLKLLYAWRDAYRFDRNERRSYFTLMQGERLRKALVRLGSHTRGSAAYAAFSAADFQAPHVRQPKTWLYVLRQEIDKFQEVADAKLVESGENLVVLIPNDAGVLCLGDAGTTIGHERLPCTNVIQTYVDLSHCGGRGEEAAEALLEQRLKPKWKTRGML